MSNCSKCGKETVCEFDLCSTCYNAQNFNFPIANLNSMYENNPQERNTCDSCGNETEPQNTVCLACEMEF